MIIVASAWPIQACRVFIGMLALFDVFPAVTQNLVVQMLNQVLTFLGLIGVIVDPTTAGLVDSDRAMGYEEPWKDN